MDVLRECLDAIQLKGCEELLSVFEMIPLHRHRNLEQQSNLQLHVNIKSALELHEFTRRN